MPGQTTVIIPDPILIRGANTIVTVAGSIILSANVNLATERATVTYDPVMRTVPDLVRTVEAAGYSAHPLATANDQDCELAHLPSQSEAPDTLRRDAGRVGPRNAGAHEGLEE